MYASFKPYSFLQKILGKSLKKLCTLHSSHTATHTGNRNMQKLHMSPINHKFSQLVSHEMVEPIHINEYFGFYLLEIAKMLGIRASRNPKNPKIKIMATKYCKRHFYLSLSQYLGRKDHLGRGKFTRYFCIYLRYYEVISTSIHPALHIATFSRSCACLYV